MAFEVARAYNEDKNLVPLYVLTDGEIPEVSPGFVASLSNVSSGDTITYYLSITNNSSNPAGGLVSKTGTSGDIAFGRKNIILVNNSPFTIVVNGTLNYQQNASTSSGYTGTICSFVNISLEPSSQSSPISSSSPNGSGWSADFYGYNLTVQRVN